MKAAVLEKIGAPLAIREVQLPENLERGQVLVKVLCTGICGSQLQEIDGLKGDPAHLPHLLGHEGCGIVEKTDEDVTTVKKDDKVVMHWRKGAGIEATLAKYGNVKAGPVTTFSEYAIVSENRVTKISDAVPNDFAALLGCALSTALATAENDANIRFGEKVLVIGCGGVGLCMILAARLRGATVGGLDISESKRATIENMSAHFGTSVARLKFDVIIDTVGNCSYAGHLAPSGRYILIGQGKGSLDFGPHLFEGDGKTIKATQGGRFNPPKDIPRYVRLWESGLLEDYKKIITHEIQIDQINNGIQLMRNGKAGRVMIEMN